MSQPAMPTRAPLLGLAPASLHALHAALAAQLGAAAAMPLQEAGYATGLALAGAMRDWLRARGEGDPSTLPLGAFGNRAGAFFSEQGWGSVVIDTSSGVATTVETHDWADWQPRESGEPPSAHFTTGLFAGFFGTLAEAPLAVLEVEPADATNGRCRFLVGSEAVVNHVFERLQQGEQAEAALAELR
jgi:predicted hydrocarbon binding protein